MANIPANSFQAIITGEVDLTNARSQFDKFKKDIEATPVKLKFDANGFNGSLGAIQNLFGKGGAQAGSQFGQQFNQSVDRIVKNIDVSKTPLNRLFNTNPHGGASIMTALGADPKLIDSFRAQLEAINKEGAYLNKMRIGDDGKIFEAEIQNANTLIRVLGTLKKDGNWSFSKTYTTNFKQAADDAESQAQRIIDGVAKVKQAFTQGDFSANAATMTKELSSISDTVSDKYVQKAQQAADEYKRITTEIKASINNTTTNPLQGQDLIDAYEKSEVALRQYQNAMKEVRADTTKMFAEGANLRAANDVESWAKKNSRAISEYGLKLEELATKMRNAKSAGELMKYQNEFRNLKSEINAAGLSGLSFGDQLKKAFSRISQFTFIYAITSKIRQLPSDMTKEVIKIDTAMTELKKVSTASADEISKYFDQAADSARKYGQTIDEVINSTASWTRLGYNLKDASILTDVTAELAQVGSGLNVDTATEGLQATIRGFGLAADEAKRVGNIINKTADEQPIDAIGVINGLERSSSALKEANNTLEESIGLITASTSVTQDATAAGTAWRTKYTNCANVQKCA